MPRARDLFAMKRCARCCTLLAAGFNLAFQAAASLRVGKQLKHSSQAPMLASIGAYTRPLLSSLLGASQGCRVPITRPWRRAPLLCDVSRTDSSRGDLCAAPVLCEALPIVASGNSGAIQSPKPAKETTAYDREGPRRLTLAIGAARVRVVASGPVQSTSSASSALCARGGPRCTREAPRRMKQTRDAIAARTAAETLTDP